MILFTLIGTIGIIGLPLVLLMGLGGDAEPGPSRQHHEKPEWEKLGYDRETYYAIMQDLARRDIDQHRS